MGFSKPKLPIATPTGLALGGQHQLKSLCQGLPQFMGRGSEVTPAPHMLASTAQNDERTQMPARVFQGEPIKNERISKTLQKPCEKSPGNVLLRKDPLTFPTCWILPSLLKGASEGCGKLKFTLDQAAAKLSGTGAATGEGRQHGRAGW